MSKAVINANEQEMRMNRCSVGAWPDPFSGECSVRGAGRSDRAALDSPAPPIE